ncbi:unnamed protein product [Auanema sp. JU1783]|nr:unnamed protein product [Auanema sp. JU1783]
MMLFHLTFLLFVSLSAIHGKYVEPPTGEYAPHCLIGDPNAKNVYHEADSYQVPWFNVDLDAPAKERFKHVVRPFKNEIQAVFDVLADFLTIIPDIPVWEIVGNFMQKMFDEGRIMQPYRDEIQGIADELQCNLGQLAFLNIFYELSRFCTSIIAQTPGNKELYHARYDISE